MGDEEADSGRRQGRAGRVRRGRGGACRAPDPLGVVPRQARQLCPGELEDAVNVTTIQVVREEAPPRLRYLSRADPLLALSALGLIACSLVTLNGASVTAIPGSPLHYVARQGVYAGAGIIVAILLARIDYSMLRQFKYGFYGLMILLNLIVLGMPAVQGSRRWIPLPLFQVQPS